MLTWLGLLTMCFTFPCYNLHLVGDYHIRANLVQGGIGSSSSSNQREESEQASCCDPAAPCALPCGRLTEFWDPQLLLELSHHPAVERCHALGVHRLSRLLKLTATYMHIIRVFGDQLGMPGNCVLTKPSS